MLASSTDFRACGDVGIPLRLELVGGGEQPGGAAVEAANKDLLDRSPGRRRWVLRCPSTLSIFVYQQPSRLPVRMIDWELTKSA